MMAIQTSLIAFVLGAALVSAATHSSSSPEKQAVGNEQPQVSSLNSPSNDSRNAPPNFQIDPKFVAEDTKHGAVLCTWMITLSTLSVHDQCHKDEAPEFRAALVESIDRINRFAAANSSTSYENMRKQADQYLARERKFDSCDGDAEDFYQLVRRGGTDQISQSTSRLLAVPRPPVLNPCL